jgi:hypothetical protein
MWEAAAIYLRPAAVAQSTASAKGWLPRTLASFTSIGSSELAVEKVTGGIGEALIATAAGLGIAIGTLVPEPGEAVIDARGCVVTIKQNAKPGSLAQIESRVPVQLVVELV